MVNALVTISIATIIIYHTKQTILESIISSYTFHMFPTSIREIVSDYLVGDSGYWRTVFNRVVKYIQTSVPQEEWEGVMMRNGWEITVAHRIEWANSRELQRANFIVSSNRSLNQIQILEWSEVNDVLDDFGFI